MECQLGLLLVAQDRLFLFLLLFIVPIAYFFLGLFVQGAGLAVLQTAANPYVTILGPEESAAKAHEYYGHL